MVGRVFRLALAGSSLCAVATAATAQESPAARTAEEVSEPNASEDIVVTATKRSERLQDVPFAISAVDTDRLTTQGEVKLIDISARVPGLQISDQAVTSKQSALVIRGLSGAGNGNPTAAIYLDDAPLNASTYFGNGTGVPDLDPGDLARIEVLKGPQGTLYGATSLGGLVKYITRPPEFLDFSARLEAGASNVKDGEWGYSVRGRINAPLSDRAALTVSAFRRRDPGFIDDPSRGRTDINSGDQYGGRAALRVRPADNVDVNLSAIYQRQKTDASNTVYLSLATGRPVGGDLQQNIIPGGGSSDARSEIFTGTARIDLGGASITSATSYISRKFEFASDLTDFFGPTLPAGTGALYRSSTNNDKFTQELRATSTSTSSFIGWQVGAFYTSENSTLHQNVDLVLATTGVSVPNAPVITRIALPSTYEEYAGSGTFTLRFASKFDIEGGARVSHNSQTSVQTVQRGALITAAAADSSESKTTFSVSARYRPWSQLTMYARIASGFRPGGPNVGQTGSKAIYGSDSAISYEIGAKGAAFDHRLTFDLAAFYVDWTKVQLQGNDPATGIQYFSNAGRARSKGLEASAVLQPVPGLTLDGNIAYTDAYLVDAFTTLAGTYAPANSQLPFSPKWAYHLGADYSARLSGEWSARTAVAYRYVGKRASFFESTAAVSRVLLDPYETVDFSLGVENRRFEINLFLRNAFDERAIVSAGQAFRTLRLGAVNQPRTFGIALVGRL